MFFFFGEMFIKVRYKITPFTVIMNGIFENYLRTMFESCDFSSRKYTYRNL